MPAADNPTGDNPQLQHSLATFSTGQQDPLAVHDALTVFDYALKGILYPTMSLLREKTGSPFFLFGLKICHSSLFVLLPLAVFDM